MNRRSARRADLDRTDARYFVYTLLAADGGALYVGRSCDVASRLRRHIFDAAKGGTYAAAKRSWLSEVRSLTMTGPFTWDQAVRAERAEIERLQPAENVDLTSRDRRPATARRSAAAGQRAS